MKMLPDLIFLGVVWYLCLQRVQAQQYKSNQFVRFLFFVGWLLLYILFFLYLGQVLRLFWTELFNTSVSPIGNGDANPYFVARFIL